MLSRSRLAGLALLALLWGSGLPGLVAGSILLHMVLHLGVVALVPALVAPRLPVRPGPLMLAVVLGTEMAVVWAWHAPGPHLWARFSAPGLVLEQAGFLAAGLLVWATAAAAGRFAGALLMFATTMHMTLLGALIGLAPRPIYGATCAGWFGLDALGEQQVAGALMALGGGAFYLVAALVRLAPGLAEAESAP